MRIVENIPYQLTLIDVFEGMMKYVSDQPLFWGDYGHAVWG
jgi:hypothetical protein